MKAYLNENKDASKVFQRAAAVSLFVLLLFVSFSCISGKPTYPNLWSPRVLDVSNVDYSGRYNATLIQLLLGDPLSKIDSTGCPFHFIINSKEIKYRLACPNQTDSLSMAFVPIFNPDFTMTFKQKSEGLQIIFKPIQNAGNPVAGFQKEFVLLSKARVGSLIVEKVAKVYGLTFMIFPVAASEYFWYRFYVGKVEILENMR